MILHPGGPPFDRESLEDSPSLQTIKDLLAALPDARLLDSLRKARGKGRGKGRIGYPVHVLWGPVVPRVALRHVTTEAMLAELRRNDVLRRLIGIESEDGVPGPWNISRFEEGRGQEPHRSLLKEVFDVLIRGLDATVPELGQATAGDSTGLLARRKEGEAAEEEIAEGLPQASGGREEYKDIEPHRAKFDRVAASGDLITDRSQDDPRPESAIIAHEARCRGTVANDPAAAPPKKGHRRAGSSSLRRGMPRRRSGYSSPIRCVPPGTSDYRSPRPPSGCCEGPRQ